MRSPLTPIAGAESPLHRRVALALTALLLGVAALLGTPHPAQAAAGSVSAYPVPSVYPASTDYKLTVNGTSVPVTKYTGYDIAQLALGTGTATISVTKLNNTAVGAYSISPQKLGITGTVSGPTLTFTVQNDEYLIVKLDGRPNLVIAADPAERNRPATGGTGIFNVQSAPYSAQPNTGTYTTTAFQTALDDAAAYGSTNGTQGIVYVPAGVYTLGNLYLRSNLALYLAPGAVLRYTGEAAHYVVTGHKNSQGRDLTWFISTRYSSTNIKIYGRGIIDGNGQAALAPADLGVNLLAPIYTSGFTVDGITFRESSSWAVIPLRSSDLAFRNIKLFNRFDMGENDGIDVMESTNVTVDHTIGIGLDDPFSTKTWPDVADIYKTVPGTARPLDNVTFNDLVSWTYCYGVKVGQGVYEPQNKVTFQHVVVYDAAVGIGVHHKYGTAAATNLKFDDIDIERLSFSNDGNRTWLALMTGNTAGIGPVTGVTISNVRVRNAGTTAARINGLPGAPISGITLSHIVMPGTTTGATTPAQLNLTDLSDYDGLTITP
ncbi:MULTISPECIES: glycosyl hydrolase family 28 protein [unclassified Streptomyces]|uniref:glycosyl hydrolase family 28 protein n=1 Tax=unclassified Streptomyces TaxID=2593676 RepID=UPI00190B4E55|nr:MULTISPECIES: glycosyl hydrolase family 28 protein [unclassified Streptomyces]MBK3565070.1 coagulation factor 5/8 type domain-containing protein [Streptomyces sp. MBT62]MBK6010701.1 coagulation factor 5/8 type domain-containing protein [Streptomyces sp. MBT53]